MDELRRTGRMAIGMMVVLTGLSGCSSSRSIQALPPSPAVPPMEEVTETEATMGRVLVNLRADGSAMPSDVDTIRLRVSEVRLREASGAWESFPVSGAPVSITTGENLVRSLLNTQVRPGAYDSLQVTFGDLYLEFGPNAGGPVTAGSVPTATRAIALRLAASNTAQVNLTLDAGASLARDANCRWYFLPYLEVGP